MNATNAKYFLPLVQALADGKTIQATKVDGSWMDFEDIGFVRKPEHYRIKPDPMHPREWTVWVMKPERGNGIMRKHGELSDTEYWEEIRVREIIG